MISRGIEVETCHRKKYLVEHELKNFHFVKTRFRVLGILRDFIIRDRQYFFHNYIQRFFSKLIFACVTRVTNLEFSGIIFLA